MLCKTLLYEDCKHRTGNIHFSGGFTYGFGFGFFSINIVIKTIYRIIISNCFDVFIFIYDSWNSYQPTIFKEY